MLLCIISYRRTNISHFLHISSLSEETLVKEIDDNYLGTD